MLLDSILAFSTDQALTTTAACENSPLDTEYADPNLGINGEIGVNIIVKTSLANATDISFDVYAGASSADAVIISKKVTAASGGLAAGQVHFIPLPKKVPRYISLTYTINGNANSGTVDAYLGVLQ